MRKNNPALIGVLMVALLMGFFIAKDIFSAPVPPPNAYQNKEKPSDADIAGGASRAPNTEPTFYGRTASDLKMQTVTPMLILDNNVLVFHCTSDELISAVWRWNLTHPDLPIVHIHPLETWPHGISRKVDYLAITFERTPLREQRG